MRIAFFSNYFNHHQKPLAEAMNAIDGVDYSFVATEPIPEFRRKLGYSEMSASYVIDTTLSVDNKIKAIELAKEADVAIFMAGGLEQYIIPRLKLKKLTFEVSERRFKKGYINMLSPNLIRHQVMYYRYGRKAPLYMLCCSAYAANDYNFLGSFVGKCFKWAYYTQVDKNYVIPKLTKENTVVRLMWCGRFINWKHPEIPVLLAARLKSLGYNFVIDMYGNGEDLEKIKSLAKDKKVEDVVNFCGNHHNEVILEAMRNHSIFLFTSDRNEGWGAVANESMSNGCVVVGSDTIGSIPFLINDGVNGLIYHGVDINSLEEKVKYLLDNPNNLEAMRKEAVLSMKNVWSPENAAKRFLLLVEALSTGNPTPFKDGPCSKAIPVHY